MKIVVTYANSKHRRVKPVRLGRFAFAATASTGWTAAGFRLAHHLPLTFGAFRHSEHLVVLALKTPFFGLSLNS